MKSISSKPSMAVVALLLVIVSTTLSITLADESPQYHNKKGQQSGGAPRQPRQFYPAESQTATFLENGFDKTNPHAVEQLLVYAEKDRSEEVFKMAKRYGYEIQGFYHTSKWRSGWKDVITEQLALLDGKRKVPKNFLDKNTTYKWDDKRWTSLLKESTGLYMNVAGTDPQQMKDIIAVVDAQKLENRDKISFNFNYTIDRMKYHHSSKEEKAKLDTQTHLSEGEFSTVDKLYDYCLDVKAQDKKALVYYMHSKGLCCPRDPDSKAKNPVASWRELMNTYVVEFPSICLRAILGKGYSTCGANNQDAHFSGNFWWTTCSHVVSLPRLWTRFDAYAVEYFVHNVSKHFHQSRNWAYQCGYSTHNFRNNHYDNECPRESYREKLYEAVMSRLPASGVVPKDNNTKVCRMLAKTPYMEQKDVIGRSFN